jgi:hypothetical protein
LVRAVVRIGIAGSRRRHFWRLLGRSLRRAPHTFAWAVGHAVMGEHAIRYTHDHVAPRIDRAIAQLRRERARAQPVSEEATDAGAPFRDSRSDRVRLREYRVAG